MKRVFGYPAFDESGEQLLTTYEGATGGKTGYTGKAGRCLVFSAERDGMELIGAVLNCPTWFDTATQLLDYGFENFREERAFAPGQQVARLPVRDGAQDSVGVLAGAALQTAVPVGILPRAELTLPEAGQAPVRKGEPLGTAALVADSREYARCPLVAAADVEARSFKGALLRLLRRWLAGFVE